MTKQLEKLSFNQSLTVIQKNKGENPFELMTIEKWNRQQLIDFLQESEEVNGKLEVTQETDKGMMITDGDIQFMVIETPIINSESVE